MTSDNTGMSNKIDRTGETRVVRVTTKLKVTGSKKAGKVWMMNVDTSTVTLANSIVNVGENRLLSLGSTDKIPYPLTGDGLLPPEL